MIIEEGRTAEPPVANEGNFDYLSYTVKAPQEPKVGETFTVIWEIHGLVNLFIDILDLDLYGVVGWGEQAWNYSWNDITLTEGITLTKTATFTVTTEGELYGGISSIFNPVSYPNDRYVGRTTFYVTQVRTKTYEELTNDYESLNQTYKALETSHNSLQNNVNSITTLMYAFISTTVVFIATTIYFAARRPRIKP